MRHATRAAILVGLIHVYAMVGCTPPTRVIVRVNAQEQALQEEITGVIIRGYSLPTTGMTPDHEVPIVRSQLHWPFSTRITPRGGDATRRFRIEATATVVIAGETPQRPHSITVRAMSSFAEGRTWELALELERMCLDVPCDVESTCRNGQCVRAEVPIEGGDAGAVEDAGMSVDARSDARACTLRSFYADNDHDGHGAGMATESCDALADHVENNDDCNDADPDAYPGAEERCDGVDQDCTMGADNGASDWCGRAPQLTALHATSATCVAGGCVANACLPAAPLCGSAECHDLDTDPNHCGRCGHACAWGRCVRGVCDDPVEIAVGSQFACAVRAMGGVACWGAGSQGQLGDGTKVDARPRPTMLGLSGVEHIGAGYAHACASTPTNVFCWGANVLGAFGDGTMTSSSSPVSIPLAGVTALALAYGNTCAISGGRVYCWGANDSGQSGAGVESILMPTPVPGLPATAADDVALGILQSCSLHGGQVWCWGVGRGVELVRDVSPGASSIAMMRFTTCASFPSSIECWGQGMFGSLGDGTTTMLRGSAPVTAPPTGSIGTARFSSLGHAACATSGATVHCWGKNEYRATGSSGAADVLVPTPVPALTDVAQVRMGEMSSCALLNSGDIYCWGDNTSGELGIGTRGGPIAMPTRVFPPL